MVDTASTTLIVAAAAFMGLAVNMVALIAVFVRIGRVLAVHDAHSADIIELKTDSKAYREELAEQRGKLAALQQRSA